MAGRVLLGRAGDPVPGLEVVLHRVGRDAGAVARDTTDGLGRFAFPRPPGADAPASTSPASDSGPPGPAAAPREPVYLVTARYRGVLYHGPPVSAAAAGGEHLLRVYEPRTADSVTVADRHAVLRPLEGGVEVVDVYRLAGPEDGALVPPVPDAPGWRLPLPAGAADARLRVDPSGPGGARLEAGGLRVTGAVPPEGRSVITRYRLPGSAATLPVRPASGPLEVLIPSDAGPADVEGARAAGTVELDGLSYRRYRRTAPAGGTVAGGPAVVVVRFGGARPSAWAWGFLAAGLLLAAAAVASARSLRRRRAPP